MKRFFERRQAIQAIQLTKATLTEVAEVLGATSYTVDKEGARFTRETSLTGISYLMKWTDWVAVENKNFPSEKYEFFPDCKFREKYEPEEHPKVRLDVGLLGKGTAI